MIRKLKGKYLVRHYSRMAHKKFSKESYIVADIFAAKAVQLGDKHGLTPTEIDSILVKHYWTKYVAE